jgi:Domain of unknown function (DUF4157)
MSGKSATTVKTETKPQVLSGDRSHLLQNKPELGNSVGLMGERGDLSPPATEISGLSEPGGFAPVLHELIQPKLTVGAPNDKYEQEADRVADQVVKMPTTGKDSVRNSSIQNQFPVIQALRIEKVASHQQEHQDLEEREEKDQSDREDDQTIIQTKSYMGQSDNVGSNIQSQLASSIGGQPLPVDTRTLMESRFGHDFSAVQVHSDANAASMNRQLNAMAFTHGQHIYFGDGQYAPNTQTGEHLLAHELTHVVQQTGGKNKYSQQPNQQSLIVSDDKPFSNEQTNSVQGDLFAQPFADISSTALQIQGFLPAYIADELNSYTRYIPGYTLFTVIVGVNPLTGVAVQPTAMNLVKGLIELVPFGSFIFDQLQKLDILQPAFNWIKNELNRFDLSFVRLEKILDEAYQEMDFLRIDPLDYNIGILKRKFGSLLNDVISFASSLVDHIIQLIKDAAIKFAEALIGKSAAWNLIKKVLHYDPLRGEEVKASTEEILADFLMLIGKQKELDQMRERGTLKKTADWIDTQLGIFSSLLLRFTKLFAAAWDAIQPSNIQNLLSDLESLATQAIELLGDVGKFALTVAIKVLEIIKDSLLSLLREHANKIPGYHLITVIIGKDVFTEEEVPLTPTNLIRGFMSLMPNGEEQFQKMEETGVIPEAAQRIEVMMVELGISWSFVKQLFLNIWNSITIDDVIKPFDTFVRITNQFAEPVGRLFTFVIEVIKVVIELVLVLMHFPTDLIGSIITNAMQAIDDIKRDPVGFLTNLLETAKLGFERFFENIAEHLVGGLTTWLFSAVSEAGITPPKDISLESILGFVLEVLGLSMNHIWEKLAEHIGQKNVDRIRGLVDRLTGIWNFIRDVQERGVAAIWEYVESQLSNLWDVVLEQVQAWTMERVINVGTRWLLSLLDVTGITPVINGFVAFFNAIESAIKYLNEMLAVVNDFVSTVASIAKGEIEPGAQRMEKGLSNSVPVVLGFLANQFGLGDIGKRLQEIIAGVREMVDKALDWLIERAMKLGRSILDALGLGKGDNVGEPKSEVDEKSGGNVNLSKPLSMEGMGHTLYAESKDGVFSIRMASDQIEFLDNLISQAIAKETRPEVVKDLQKFNDNSFYKEYGIVSLRDLKIVESRADIMPVPGANFITIKQIPGLLDRLALVLSVFGDKYDIPSLRDLNQQPESLKNAVEAKGIIIFMKEIAENGKSGDVSRESFYRLYEDTSKTLKVGNNQITVRKWLQDSFRNFRKGKHEWIPTVLIDKIVERASSPTIFVDGLKWIDLQNNLRTDTKWVVFKPIISSKTITEGIGGTPLQTYLLLQGHPGAIYFRGKEQVEKSNEFHAELNALLTPDIETIPMFIDKLKKDVFEHWVLNPEVDSLPLIHPDLEWNGIELGKGENLKGFSTQQSKKYKEMVKHFDEMKKSK